MKTSVVYAAGIVCCLIGGMSTYAWSEDLESALDNVNISTDAQNNPKKDENTANVPCTKATEANCHSAHNDDVNSTAYQATTLQQNILNAPYVHGGTIRREPTDAEEIVVAAFTGNHNVAEGVDQGTFDWAHWVWFPHSDVTTHVRAHDPDFLFFSGDQVYEGASPTRADFTHPYEDYLYKWYL